jgi:hypothetical protein
MKRLKLKPAGVVLAFLLLAAGSFWWLDDQEKTTSGVPPPVRGGPLMTGVRFSAWEGPRCVYTLDISGLELIPKRLGPFRLGDSKDINASDCRLEAEEDTLAATFREIGRTLVNLAKPRRPPSAEATEDWDPQQALIVFPPKITATPFAGRIEAPGEHRLAIRAGQLSFDPQEPCLRLKGEVQVASQSGAVLRADEAYWELPRQRMLVAGGFTLERNRQTIKGSSAQFSLAGGEITRLSPGGRAPAAQGPPNSPGLPMTLLVQTLAGKNLRGFETVMLPLLAAAQAGSATSLELSRLITDPNFSAPRPR